MLLPPIRGVHKTATPTPVNRTATFHLPSALNADRPPERRGLARDRVRLLVLNRNTGKVTVISPRLGDWVITRTSTRSSRARRRCRAPAVHLPGGFFCNCEIEALRAPQSLCMQDCLRILIKSSTTLLLRKSIGLAKKQPAKSAEQKIQVAALWPSVRPWYER